MRRFALPAVGALFVLAVAFRHDLGALRHWAGEGGSYGRAPATFYVDGACARNGDGTADRCASAAGGTGAYNSGAGLQAAIDRAACGDTVVVKKFDGAYSDTVNGHGGYESAAFYIEGKICSPAAELVIRGANRAAKPKLCTRPDCGPVDQYTVGGRDLAYVVIRDFEVDGAIGFVNPRTADHLEIAYNDLHGGVGCTGNFSLLYLSDTTHAWVHHNYLHDLATWCVTGNSHWDGGKTFRTRYDTWEYNTVAQGASSRTITHSIDLKDCTYFDTFRFNRLGAGELAINRQTGSCGRQPQGTSIYGNVSAGGIVAYAGIDKSLNIYGNTLVAGPLACIQDAPWGGIRVASVHDNIVVRGGRKDFPDMNVEIGPESWSHKDHYAWDFNVYAKGAGYRGGDTTYRGLRAWRNAFGGGRDAHSTERACTFVSTSLASPDYFRLRPGDPCAKIGTDGGQAGAYGVTDCVGHLCD